MGTSGIRRRTFLYTLAVTAVVVGVVVTQNVIGEMHARPALNPLEPVIWEWSSWITLMAVFWMPWVAYRLAPPWARPRWRLLVHLPMVILFSLAHVGGFILLRELAYWLAGGHYVFGNFRPTFAYEFRKDGLGYCAIIAGFWLIEHLLRQQQLVAMPGQSLTFDIRDGTKLTRVRLAEIIAVASAGNYVEFVLLGGRRLLTRSPLAAVEEDLARHGFVRTHRSWLVNATLVTGLTRVGSGDYSVALPDLTVPLSRRYKAALAQIRAGR